MDWRRAGLFVLFLIVGAFVALLPFAVLSMTSLLIPLFFIAYVIVLASAFRRLSRKKAFLLIALTVMYLALSIVPFPTCDSWGAFSGRTQECTCIGLEKHNSGLYDASWSQCMGIPTNYRVSYSKCPGSCKDSCSQDFEAALSGRNACTAQNQVCCVPLG
jgi:hypothetical protein